jgi:transposase
VLSARTKKRAGGPGKGRNDVRSAKGTNGGKTVVFNEYIVGATSLPDSVSPDEALETYRRRRQIEIYFKRLKSILDLGELPKKNPTASEARLNGKIMVALLIEAFIGKGSFSSGKPVEYQPQYMA